MRVVPVFVFAQVLMKGIFLFSTDSNLEMFTRNPSGRFQPLSLYVCGFLENSLQDRDVRNIYGLKYYDQCYPIAPCSTCASPDIV